MCGILKSLLRDTKGSFAMFAAMGMLLLLLVIGVAVDFGRLQSTQTSAQDDIDGAVLAAARYMTDSLSSGASEDVRQAAAKQIAIDYLLAYAGGHDISLTLEDLIFTDSSVTVIAKTQSEPYFASLLGINTLDVQVTSSATTGAQVAKDVDVVLVADATASMAATLTGIQTNMKDFTTDLSNELTSSGITLGVVRVQFIFYRDYMADIHKDWTGPDMDLLPGLEGKGPMYISPFFTVPAEKIDMDEYVDYFVASGGGSFHESGIEATWHALKTNWKSGETTVRSIILWTDAQTRPLGDKEEWAMDNTSGPSFYFNDAYWKENMSDAFAALSKDARQNYAYDNFYPVDVPSTMGKIKSEFSKFQIENSSGISDVKTMSINVVSNCWDNTPCTDWPEIATWKGVDLTVNPVGVSSTETYDSIVKQVAATVISQVTARDLAITH